MNKEFIKKILLAEKLRYEAFKELLPENAKTKVNAMEKDAISLLKDIALEMFAEGIQGENGKDNKERKEVKKVSVDFL